MDINWSEILWQGRLDALVMMWNAVVIGVGTYWWFGPLLVVLVIADGPKGVLRLGAYVTRVLAHTHGPS